MIGALVAAARFLGRHPGSVLGLYLLNGMVFAAVLVTYSFVAPGAPTTGASVWIGFLVTRLYLLARLWVKLVFYASETAFFQASLAHAGYAAAPLPRWPDSPSADAVVPPGPQPQ